MKSVRLLITAVAALVTLAATAPKAGTGELGEISGRVTDARTGAPVTGAWVAVVETNVGAETDSLGYYHIENLAPGVYTLVVTHSRYGTVRGLAHMKVKIADGTQATANLQLMPAAGEEAEHDLSQSADITGNEPMSEAGKLQLYDEVRRQSRERIKAETSVGLPTEGYAGGTNSIRKVGLPTPPPGVPQPTLYNDYEQQYGSLPPFDMYFRDYGTNRFVDTRNDRFSTFAADVDDASYTLVRRYLQEGNVPPEEAVRIEEFINHFDYGYNNPSGDVFRIFTELTDSPFDNQKTVLKIGIKGRESDRRERNPLRLTLVVDVSGSMGYDNRMELVKRSLKMLVGQLDSRDRVGMIAYGSSAYVVLEPIPAGNTDLFYRALNRLRPGGSTFAEAGLRLGYEMANRQYAKGCDNMIVLCSDGVANVGRTSPEAIMAEIGRFARKGLSLSTFGFGMGNYNDVLLEQLAQKGDGRYAYINNDAEAHKAVVQDFLSNTEMLARDVKIQVEFDPSIVRSYRLIGYENRDVADYRFRDNSQDGGEIGAGHEVTALYELVLTGRAKRSDLATVHVRWKNPNETRVSEVAHEVSFKQDRQRFDKSRPELRLAIVAGRFAEILKGTVYANETSYRDLLRLAEPIRRELPSEETDELIDLIRLAQGLSCYHTDVREDGPYGYNSNYKR